VSDPSDAERQIESLYASIGRIAVHAEHLSHAMNECCSGLLRGQGDNEFVQTALAGHNIESMRRVWVSMMKLAYREDAETSEMIDHMARRIDNITQRRNDTIHRLWFIGYGEAGQTSFEVADSMKVTRDIRDRGAGGIRVTKRDSQDFEEIISEIIHLTKLVWRFTLCVLFGERPAEGLKFEDGKLTEG
jgi:hypothetical protein